MYNKAISIDCRDGFRLVNMKYPFTECKKIQSSRTLEVPLLSAFSVLDIKFETKTYW